MTGAIDGILGIVWLFLKAAAVVWGLKGFLWLWRRFNRNSRTRV